MILPHNSTPDVETIELIGGPYDGMKIDVRPDRHRILLAWEGVAELYLRFDSTPRMCSIDALAKIGGAR